MISIVIVAFYAVWAAVQGFGGGPLRPRLFAEVGVAVYAGVTVMIAVDQMHAPGDRQAANMLIFGGIALLNLTVWLQLRREARQ
ncbi:hypothetical protein AB0O47_39410 [Streptomyces noursei]|uniref:hypothetical protein n=1 Tax=Streptomyces noursei TaxID=1971 RepID=UPI0034501B3F